MKRRNFIKHVSSAATGSILLPQFMTRGSTFSSTIRMEKQEKLKGFIVSDAHFGWIGRMQPDPAYQKMMMELIAERFPDLDVFIDTGDAHHNDHHENKDPYKARQDWCDIIQRGCGQTPFYYVIGNHEIRSNEDDDPEMRSNIMGSSSCRPYYSFDIKGIHFISFPELIRAVYITEEEYSWLALDLELNKDKTTILLSHNNILGTTSGNEAGYRGIMDSQKMLGIFKEYPNIISWMHGHNHNFEIVEQQNMLFVSNGRIGGFDPSKGLHGLGGIYFEISTDGFTVKCYSAEKGIFLEELSSELSKTLKVPTSFSPDAPHAYSYGVGGAIDKERIPVFNHHSGINQRREVFIAGCENETINDDPYFTRYAERHTWHGLDKILMAAKVNHGNSVFDYLNPGIRLKSNTDWWTTVTLPSDNYSLYSYYRCPVDTTYKVEIDLNTDQVKTEGKQVLWLRLLVYNIQGRLLRVVQSEGINLVNGRQKHEEVLKVPALNDFNTIYSDKESDNLVNIAVEASFSGMEKGDIEIYSVKFSEAYAEGKTLNPGILLNENRNISKGIVDNNKIVKLDILAHFQDRDVVEVIADGNKRMTFLVRHSNLEWQVRNATVMDYGNYLEIKKMRNRLSAKMEVIIVPLIRLTTPYVYRIRNAEEIKIHPLSRGNETLKVEIGHLMKDQGQIEVFSTEKPVNVIGTSSWSYENNIIVADIRYTGVVEFIF